MTRIVIQRTQGGEPSNANAPAPQRPAPPPLPDPPRRPRRVRRVLRARRWAWWAIVVIVGLIFRRAVTWLVITALSAALHFAGLNVHLPSIRFGWPWQSAISTGTTTSTIVGPWVLQKIEGISKPALGTENFDFLFTHQVSKNIGPWPCWYSATFYAVGHASATVDLNPGASWWKKPAGHYLLRVLRAPAGSTGGAVAVTMALPAPQLPQTAHDVTIDNTLSAPVSTSHSWTYPGLGCGVLIKPQFAQSVLYSDAQTEAFYRVSHVSSVTRPLIKAAESQASTMIRDNFLQPTLNALGYRLTSFTIRWVSGS